ncbi:MAG TPA: phosphate acetyltransferase [Intrasporangiaceae bacterium]|nr:phosphate acetyltransferase [Intrasporangiaceae bacterium]
MTSLYLSATDARSGKSAVALGILDQLARRHGRIGVFRPIAAPDDELVQLLLRQLTVLGMEDLGQDPAGAIGVTYEEVHAGVEAAMNRIVDRFHAVAAQFDTVLIIGSDFADVTAPSEFAFNAKVAANLGAPMLLVIPGEERDPQATSTAARLAITAARDQHATVVGVVANQVPDERVEATREALSATVTDTTVCVVPDVPLLRAPTMQDYLDATGGRLIHGDESLLERECHGIVVAAMTMPHVLDRLIEGGVVVVPGDREAIVIGTLLAHRSTTFPALSGIILNGGFELSPQVSRLIDGVDVSLPIVSVATGTMDTASRLLHTSGRITPTSQRKIDAAIAAVEGVIDAGALFADDDRPNHERVVTPLMFEHDLVDTARSVQAHIVLPEGTEPRILEAAEIVQERGIARLTLLGEPDAVQAVARDRGIDLSGIEIVDPQTSDWRDGFADEYARLRAHKGMTVEAAADIVTDRSYFGTLMVHQGLADGMVSGTVTTTAATVRPALEIVRTSPGVSVVSSVFFMCLADRVLVYGDCAINPVPNETQLADIAISSARTATQFGIEPRVAMLSYSTGASGTGADVEKVRAATEIVMERAPELLIEGPIQYDAAVDPAVAATKLKDSPVAGSATVLIFPDLNTGNNTYKAVQRSASAVAIGPILQGLGKPVNDLSRGALVRDIVNTIAITAIQAGVR